MSHSPISYLLSLPYCLLDCVGLRPEVTKIRVHKNAEALAHMLTLTCTEL